jgi:hypothetical protein
MVWWFVVAAVVLRVAVALWRLNTRIKRRDGNTHERQSFDPHDPYGGGGGSSFN